MAIIRKKAVSNYTTLSNEVFKKNTLSWQAMGLLCFLLSKPDKWEIMPKALAKITEGTSKKTGLEGVYTILRELKNVGFVEMKKHSSGRVDYFVFDSPNQTIETGKPNEESPVSQAHEQENPDKGNPDKGNPDKGKDYAILSKEYIPSPEKLISTDSKQKEKEKEKEIFVFWQKTFSKQRSKFTPDRQKLIKKALNLGYSADDLKQAIHGCSISAFHMGSNDNGKVYDSIELIFRNTEKIEGFMYTTTDTLRPIVKQTSAEDEINATADALLELQINSNAIEGQCQRIQI
jgi:hypothetical protein